MINEAMLTEPETIGMAASEWPLAPCFSLLFGRVS